MRKTFFDNVKEFFGFTERDEVKNDGAADVAPKSVVRSFRGSLVNNQNSRQFLTSEIKVVEPRIYEDSLNIAMYLRDNIPVVVNLKYLDAPASKRLIDFVCGTAYAINGHMMKIGENIFLFTPVDVSIVDSGEKTTFEQGLEQEEKEVFFKRAAL
ncbi:MAG: cell division protein SepF [bacterium]|nr:cell division protein SepF [bacterium]